MDKAAKENRSSVSKPKLRQGRPRPKRPTPKVYGYALKDAWIIEYAVKHGLGTAENAYLATQRVFSKIMRETRMGSFCTIKCDNGNRGTGLCLQFGNNWSRNGMHSMTKEKIELAKRVLEMTEEPQWYDAD